MSGVMPAVAGLPHTSSRRRCERRHRLVERGGVRIFPATRAVIDTLLGRLCVGRDATQIVALNGDVQRVLHSIGRNGPAIYALSGIDIALWDIAGKASGLPLYHLLGASRRADLPAYASLLRYAGWPEGSASGCAIVRSASLVDGRRAAAAALLR